VQWRTRIEGLKRLPSGLYDEQLLWRLFHLFVLSVGVFLLVFSWMSWLEQELRPDLRVEAAVEASGKKGSTGSDSPESRPSLEEYRQTVAGDLFGAVREAEGQDSTEEESLEEIPLSEKDLQQKLVGTIVLGDPEENIAVIEDTRSGEQEMYTSGDRIGEIRIESVLRDNVVITSSGEKRVLTMQYKQLRDTGVSRRAAGSASTASEMSSANRNISRDFVMRSLQDMSGLMQSALIRPYQQDGETAGFQLDNIRSGSFYDRIGLRNNDVILSIDDTQLKSPQQLMEFSQELRRKDQVTMTLRRDGERRRIQYRLR